MTMIPPQGVEEAAKAVQKLSDLASGLGGWLASVVGSAPADMVGIAGADWLREVRIRNVDKFRRRTEGILEERNVKDRIEVSPSLAEPLIQAAANQNNDDLRELFARLLAAAMDPARKDRVRTSFIEIANRLEPIDALILQQLRSELGRETYFAASARQRFADSFNRTQDEVAVSIMDLSKLQLVELRSNGHVALTELGRLFMYAVSD